MPEIMNFKEGENLFTYAQALNQALREEMTRDPKVLLLGEDIGEYGGIFTVTRNLHREFGADRVLDTPISEGAFTGAALGLSLTGYRPIIEIMFVDFLFVAGDQLFNHVGKIHYTSGGQCKVPFVVRTQQGANIGKAAQHSQSLEAIFCHMPGWTVVAPSQPSDAKGLMKAAIRHDSPVAFIEHKALYFRKGNVPQDDTIVPIGKARIARKGRDVTLISYSRALELTLQAAETLAKDGIEAEVIDLRTLKPLDQETILSSIGRTTRAVVVHEANQFCGFGAELVSLIQEKAFYYLDAPVQRVAALDIPLPFNRTLESKVLPSVERIVAAAHATMEKH